MLDGRRILPRGWHPESPHTLPDGKTQLCKSKGAQVPGYAVGGVRYYYIDFGFSVKDQDVWHKSSASRGLEAPEILGRKPYDPYKVDIWNLGLLFEEYLVGVSTLQCSTAIPPLLDKLFDPATPGTRVSATIGHFNDLRGPAGSPNGRKSAP